MGTTPVNPDCESVLDDLAALALGALTGHDRARVVAHLEHCPHCAAELEELSGAADALNIILPEASPPEGFADRTLASIANESRTLTPMAKESRGQRRRPHAWRLGAVAAAAVVLLAVGGGAGALLASRHPDAPTAAVRTAPIHSTRGAGGTVVLLSSDQRSWLVMDLHGGPTSGTVACTLALKDGGHRVIGEFSLADGYGSWTARLPVPPSSVAQVELVDAGGTTVASARFG